MKTFKEFNEEAQYHLHELGGDTNLGIIPLVSKGFGFIINDETGEDMFVHSTALDGITIKEGDKVNYEEGEGRKGKAATNVTLA